MICVKLFAIFFLTFNFAYSQSSGKCKVLALEGGGDKGAYQVGALQAFLAQLGAEQIQYDVYSGVSVGSLNSAALSFFDKGDEANQIQFLYNIWTNIQSSDVYENYNILGPAYALFEEVSLYSTQPLKNFLTNILSNNTIKRKVSFGTCDANNGSFVRIRGDLLTSKDDIVNSVLASSAVPVIFPPISLFNNQYIDGGTVLNLDIGGGVQRCKEMGFSDQDIIVDAILCSGSQLEQTGGDYDKSYQAIGRLLQILWYQHALDDLLHIQNDFPDVNFRYVVIPTKKLESGLVPLSFNKNEILSMIQQGIDDATAVLKQGEKVYFSKLLKQIQEEKKEQEDDIVKTLSRKEKQEIANLYKKLLAKKKN